MLFEITESDSTPSKGYNCNNSECYKRPNTNGSSENTDTGSNDGETSEFKGKKKLSIDDELINDIVIELENLPKAKTYSCRYNISPEASFKSATLNRRRKKGTDVLKLLAEL